MIAYGAPHKHNTHGAHGAPLGEEEVKLTKEVYGWPADQKFLVPPEVPAHFRANFGARGRKLHDEWKALRDEYARQFPELGQELDLLVHHKLPDGWDAEMKPFPADAKGMATRASSGKVLNQIAKRLPWLVGGSGDLAPSTLTLIDGGGDFEAGSYGSRNLHFGIREHAMGAAVNGMCLTGLRAFGATFFVFTDYMRPSIRLAAIMGLPAFWVFTHDSIGVGEDGPTHQPIEHLAALRTIPNLTVIRPGDANEVAEAYRSAILNAHGPTALVLSRQNVPTLDRSKFAADPLRGYPAGASKGGYVLADAADGRPDVILIGTGTELSLCVAAYEKLTAEGVKTARREPAELGTVRRPAAVLPRRGAAARRDAPRGRRAGRRARLVQVSRTEGAVPWHDILRCFRAGGRALEAFRVHGRECGQAGEGNRTIGYALPLISRPTATWR